MRNIKVLFTDADGARLQPLFEQLCARGLRVQEAGDTLKTSDVVLAALSENAYADAALVDRVLGLIGAGAETVLPLQLDSAAMPDALKNALYARNIIFAAERDDKLLAERIVDALPKKKNRLPLILSVAAVVFIAVAGLLIGRAAQSREAVPAMVEEPITIPVSLGLTEEDLAAIEDVVIVGDYFGYVTHEQMQTDEIKDMHWLNVTDDVAYRIYDNNGETVWISKEDGHAYAMTRYDDLRFLGLMKNLQFLELVNVEADADKLPDLSKCAVLSYARVYDCKIDSLDWLSGAHIHSFAISGTPTADYSPLSSCRRLTEVRIDLLGVREADLSGFAPPKLETLHVNSGEELRAAAFDGLSSSEELEELSLDGLPVEELSFLAGKTGLKSLELRNLNRLRDISAVGTLTSLRELEIDYCPRVTDYTAIAGCTALEELIIHCDTNPDALRDASFLAKLPKLHNLKLHSTRVQNLDFLYGLAEHQSSFALSFSGEIGDYSGLAAFSHYDHLHVNPRGYNGGRFGDFGAVQPYIRDATVDALQLYNCRNVDLSALPEVTQNLQIFYGDLTDLTGLRDYPIHSLSLWNCPYLSSLEGIRVLPELSSGSMELSIRNCPRLTDYSALDGAVLQNLKLVGLYALPDFGALTPKGLWLESIEGLSDLKILNGLSDGMYFHTLSLAGLDQLRDLSPLYRLHGNDLRVPPQVADQAAELVASGNFSRYEVAFPDGSWQPLQGGVMLLSLDELNTLPKALLRRVERLTVAGDRVLDEDSFEVVSTWENGGPVYKLRERATGEESPLPDGSIGDLSVFADLTGLKELRLCSQPLTSLDGIQDFAQLSVFEAQNCSALTDASALFALQELREIRLQNCPVSSIQGIQNLTQLGWLDLSGTKITDLTPLAGCDFSAAEAQGGLDFSLNELELDAEDFAALGTIRHFNSLNFSNADPAVWIPALADTEIERIGAAGDLHSNEDLAAFAADHPELRSLWLGWSEITDLTPLLALENLEQVSIDGRMEEAIHSLDGQNCSFVLNY